MKNQKLSRMSAILKILLEEGLGIVAFRLGLSKDPKDESAPPEQQDGYPLRVRRVLERLGPLFVKFGQVLSTREDLLPKEYCEAFVSLQSSVPPFDSEVAISIIEEELGKTHTEVFDEFEKRPLAAASLAQVHTARLKDGRHVVVKVQRPDASSQIVGDTEMLLWLSRQLDRFLPFYKARRIHAMAEEFTRASLVELNFLHEATIADRFRKNFEALPQIYIPQMMKDLSTGRVLVMERIFGHKLDEFERPEDLEKAGISVKDLVSTLLKTVFTQAYVHGLIHADLHPGNIFLLEDGRIAMIDFGLYGELSRSMQNALFRTVLYRTHFKHTELAESMLELMEPIEGADPVGFRRAIIEASKRLEGASIADISLAHTLQEEAVIASKYGYIAPNELMMLARALVTAEGIAIKFTPDLVITEFLRPIMRDIALQRFDVERIVRDGLLVLPDILEMIELAPAFHRNLLKVERAFAKSANLSEFVTSQFLGAPPPSRRERGRLSTLFLPLLLWLIAGASVLSQSSPIQTLGDLSLLSGLSLVAALVTTLNALQRE